MKIHLLASVATPDPQTDMQNELEILRDVSSRFERAAVPYVLTGPLALNHYVKSHESRDKDIVIALAARDPNLIGRLFIPDYYVSLEAPQDALSHQSLFCVRQENIFKVDCIVRNHEQFRAAELERRQKVRIEDFETWIATKEDLLISILSTTQQLHLEFQPRHVRELLSGGCDRSYIERWAQALNLGSL